MTRTTVAKPDKAERLETAKAAQAKAIQAAASSYDPGVLIADVQKNALDTIRVRLTNYKNHKLLDLRQFYEDGAGELKPTGKGFSIRRDQAGELLKALEAAVAVIGSSAHSEIEA